MNAKQVSAIIMQEIEVTTLEVVASPTASAPPVACKPLLQEINVTSQPKTSDFIVLFKKSIGSIPLRIELK